MATDWRGFTSPTYFQDFIGKKRQYMHFIAALKIPLRNATIQSQLIPIRKLIRTALSLRANAIAAFTNCSLMKPSAQALYSTACLFI